MVKVYGVFWPVKVPSMTMAAPAGSEVTAILPVIMCVLLSIGISKYVNWSAGAVAEVPPNCVVTWTSTVWPDALVLVIV